ncbi:DUF4253 domain-containing protein [Streptomyces turgidiscabies]|uniref:DUF4253 domain-containing protein n=1 Tax=Streptomyces turgidiscabies (strain Car8) TaxID=698760 RepID=L7FKQ2_STRT8|nr:MULTISPECIES: DUF4253 domain-containing protein [Streptomyces]ELP71250.1 hypothetical protein STRTUCAR8_04804 [Streptomyces turgidiscabies Car8]MDX3498783.1 DUF4253 domain-containing protein [Streptomyces turgidiscabies]GAQ74789.1 hypothetical protein T45_06569 [Streptomyces turgidiscabies]
MATLPNPLPHLATDPTGSALGLALPAGRLIDATHDGPWHEPLLWHADAPYAPGDWAAHHDAWRAAGLLPVVIEVGGGQGGPEEWELMPADISYPGDHDPEEVLTGFWEEYAAEGEDWPGLAPGTDAESSQADADALVAWFADSTLVVGSSLKEPRLALVPARRSADIPAAIGWSGPANYESDTARLCAVLRSWEDRFGIRVLALTFNQLVLSVAAPPTTLAEAEATAAEHFAFCPDNITQGAHTTLRAYAEHELLAKPTWSFWWD